MPLTEIDIFLQIEYNISNCQAVDCIDKLRWKEASNADSDSENLLLESSSPLYISKMQSGDEKTFESGGSTQAGAITNLHLAKSGIHNTK